MPNCNYAWRRYEELQESARESQHVNNYFWGIESALNFLVRAIETDTVPADPVVLEGIISRKVASGARLQRSRSQTLRTWMRPAESMSTASLAEANMELERIDRAVNDHEREILMEAAYGYTDREMARRHASTPGAMRVRLSRIRLKLCRNEASVAHPYGCWIQKNAVANQAA